jgi:hypothetical protein
MNIKFPATIYGVILFLLPLLFLPQGNLQARKLSLLFIGNNYTATNNLPQLLGLVASSQGDTLISDINTPGGFTFKNHFENAITRENTGREILVVWTRKS